MFFRRYIARQMEKKKFVKNENVFMRIILNVEVYHYPSFDIESVHDLVYSHVMICLTIPMY